MCDQWLSTDGTRESSGERLISNPFWSVSVYDKTHDKFIRTDSLYLFTHAYISLVCARNVDVYRSSAIRNGVLMNNTLPNVYGLLQQINNMRLWFISFRLTIVYRSFYIIDAVFKHFESLFVLDLVDFSLRFIVPHLYVDYMLSTKLNSFVQFFILYKSKSFTNFPYLTIPCLNKTTVFFCHDENKNL